MNIENQRGAPRLAGPGNGCLNLIGAFLYRGKPVREVAAEAQHISPDLPSTNNRTDDIQARRYKRRPDEPMPIDVWLQLENIKTTLQDRIQYGEYWRIARDLDEIDISLETKNKLVNSAKEMKKLREEAELASLPPAERDEARKRFMKEDLERQKRISQTDAFKKLSPWAKETMAPDLPRKG